MTGTREPFFQGESGNGFKALVGSGERSPFREESKEFPSAREEAAEERSGGKSLGNGGDPTTSLDKDAPRRLGKSLVQTHFRKNLNPSDTDSDFSSNLLDYKPPVKNYDHVHVSFIQCAFKDTSSISLKRKLTLVHELFQV